MRRFVLVAYDVSEDKRLRQIFKLLRGYGEHIQFSIFLCRLTDKDYLVLSEKIRDIVNQNEDRVFLVKLGPIGRRRKTLPDRWEIIGMSPPLNVHNAMIY